MIAFPFIILDRQKGPVLPGTPTSVFVINSTQARKQAIMSEITKTQKQHKRGYFMWGKFNKFWGKVY
jgi:hypothetical protein